MNPVFLALCLNNNYYVKNVMSSKEKENLNNEPLEKKSFPWNYRLNINNKTAIAHIVNLDTVSYPSRSVLSLFFSCIFVEAVDNNFSYTQWINDTAPECLKRECSPYGWSR